MLLSNALSVTQGYLRLIKLCHNQMHISVFPLWSQMNKINPYMEMSNQTCIQKHQNTNFQKWVPWMPSLKKKKEKKKVVYIKAYKPIGHAGMINPYLIYWDQIKETVFFFKGMDRSQQQ